MIITLIALTVLGLCFGSFVNALVWRLHTGRDWVKERSQCPKCHHQLASKDLIPLVSWLALGGRCRYCHKPISKQYPLVELAMAVVFVLSYVFWPADLAGGEARLQLATWLAASVGLMALLVYDSRWQLLPSRILYPTLAIAAAGRLADILIYKPDIMGALVDWALALAVGAGVFWLIFHISKGQWIGYGDVRLGLVIGTLVIGPVEAAATIFLASLIGSLVMIPMLLSGHKQMTDRLAFGPFLIVATWLVVMAGDRLAGWFPALFT